jgi:flavin reductase (DIM6/NTAB) family NADH-FMN oxidoreductase RutF
MRKRRPRTGAVRLRRVTKAGPTPSHARFRDSARPGATGRTSTKNDEREKKVSVLTHGSGPAGGADPAGFDPADFKRAFRGHPAGVVVITVDGGRGPAGFTATSLASLSLDPPLVSFGISVTASSWPHVRDAESAVVHFLGAGHEHVARRFATSGIDRFAEPTSWRRLPDGSPVLNETAGWLRVRIADRIAAGDHRVVIGLVEEGDIRDGHRPLLYHDGAYHSL